MVEEKIRSNWEIHYQGRLNLVFDPTNFYVVNWRIPEKSLDLSLCGGLRIPPKIELVQLHSDSPNKDCMVVSPEEILWDTQSMAAIFIGDSPHTLNRFLTEHGLPTMPDPFYRDYVIAAKLYSETPIWVR